MLAHNEIVAPAPPEVCLELAADVEAWPTLLPHYRRVRFRRRDGRGAGRVEMAAVRRFGPLPYPVWWVSEMSTDFQALRIRYRHVEGITRGMEVEWRLEPAPWGTRIEIVHAWTGPEWPLVGGFAARRVIGPHFVRVVADRTLAGIARAARERAGDVPHGRAARGDEERDDRTRPGDGGPRARA